MISPRAKRRAGSRALMYLVLLILGTGCASTRVPSSGSSPSAGEFSKVGLASYYAHKFHGKRTASGERYNMHKMTAAHRSLSFGTNVRVTNVENNRDVVVRINDRGPFVRKRIIDVSLAAARELGMIKSGVARVRVEVVSAKTKEPTLVRREE